MLNKLLTALVLLFCHVNSEKFNFTNYALYKVIPSTSEELKVLNLMLDNRELDFFEDPVGVNGIVGVVTSPAYRKTFEEILKANDIDAEVTIENIQTAIDNQKIGKYVQRNVKSMTWDAYYTFEDIYSWLDDLAASNSDVVTLINGGSSHEGREIKGVKISHGSGRRNIFIEGGIHAREWISYATVNYIISELLYSDDPETKAAANDFDWYIFPCTNPDGYVWTHTDFRLWRKNRRPVGTEFGIDLNRNWNSNWLEKGSSMDPSSNTYAGLGPFSEIETRSLSAFIESVADTMDMYISFHSSGQLLMVPYGNTTDPLDNYYDTVKIGRRAMGSLSVRYGTPYVTGNIAEAIYEATGSSVDWVKEKLRVPLTYCYELRDRGQYGHLLPADQILPNNEEVMDSVLALIREGRALGYFNSSISVKSSVITFLFGIFIIISHLINEATGTSVDWVKEKLRVPLTYCYELRDRGQYGHLLPADQILPNNEEVMDSVLALIREGRALGYFNSSISVKSSGIALFIGIFMYFIY